MVSPSMTMTMSLSLSLFPIEKKGPRPKGHREPKSTETPSPGPQKHYATLCRMSHCLTTPCFLQKRHQRTDKKNKAHKANDASS